jgi:hypothetical protein
VFVDEKDIFRFVRQLPGMAEERKKRDDSRNDRIAVRDKEGI